MTSPSKSGYSSHEGAERAEWDDEKLVRVGDRPVVYPAAGSHANKYGDALWLGSSAEAGVGCDDTRGPHRELSPRVVTIPSDSKAAAAAYPWIAFEGRWGELQKAFYNGPTGPNLKTQWTLPITWSEDWRDRSYAIPTGGAFGTGSTDFFCSAVAKGSRALTQLLINPLPLLVVLGTLLGLVIFAAVRATWTPVAPLRIATPTVVGPGHRRLGAHVRQAPGLVPRAGRAPHPHRGRHDAGAMAPDRDDRSARNRVGRGSGRVGIPLGDRRHDVRAARARSRHGRDGVRAGRDRRESFGSARGTRIGLRCAGSDHFSERSPSSFSPGWC